MEVCMFTLKVNPPVDYTDGYINRPNNINVSRSSRTILAVDADRNVLNQLSQSFSLCAKHCNIITTQSGREAIEILETFPVDILLTDFKMAVSGQSLIAHTKAYYPSIQIFVMSADAPSDIENSVRDLGICGHISKPCRIEMIYSVLRV
jgi:CheY-like chemotaxis protein